MLKSIKASEFSKLFVNSLCSIKFISIIYEFEWSKIIEGGTIEIKAFLGFLLDKSISIFSVKDIIEKDRSSKSYFYSQSTLSI